MIPDTLRGHDDVKSVNPVRQAEGLLVTSYRELAAKIATLQFDNPHLVLLFRGQRKDHRIERNQWSMIRPTIFRQEKIYGTDGWKDELARRFKKLQVAEDLLSDGWPVNRDNNGVLLESTRRLVRSNVIKWAILQHYDVCGTPLLDVSHSLRVAASFASINNTSEVAYLMVLGVPQISGAVSVCADSGIQTLRLSSLCPPSATRPHLQEGYLLGEYPEIRTIKEMKGRYTHETDFSQRLVGKFQFRPKDFESDPNFPLIPMEALNPNEDDEISSLCASIKTQIELSESAGT